MTALAYSDASKSLDSTMDRVCDDHNPVAITREKKKAVVMISLEDYEELETTALLSLSAKNRKQILEGIAQLDAGKGIVKDFEELKKLEEIRESA